MRHRSRSSLKSFIAVGVTISVAPPSLERRKHLTIYGSRCKSTADSLNNLQLLDYSWCCIVAAGSLMFLCKWVGLSEGIWSKAHGPSFGTMLSPTKLHSLRKICHFFILQNAVDRLSEFIKLGLSKILWTCAEFSIKNNLLVFFWSAILFGLELNLLTQCASTATCSTHSETHI